MVRTASVLANSSGGTVSESQPTDRYEALIRVSQAIGAHRDPKDLFRAMATELRRVVPFDGMVITQYDEEIGPEFAERLTESDQTQSH